jgi:hypothetical protein
MNLCVCALRMVLKFGVFFSAPVELARPRQLPFWVCCKLAGRDGAQLSGGRCPGSGPVSNGAGHPSWLQVLGPDVWA